MNSPVFCLIARLHWKDRGLLKQHLYWTFTYATFLHFLCSCFLLYLFACFRSVCFSLGHVFPKLPTASKCDVRFNFKMSTNWAASKCQFSPYIKMWGWFVFYTFLTANVVRHQAIIILLFIFTKQCHCFFVLKCPFILAHSYLNDGRTCILFC